jgi:hypothetical protein
MKPRAFLLAALVLTSTTGCDQVLIGAVSQNRNSVCQPPQGIQLELVYPANGATGLPDNIGEVVFAASADMPANYRAYLIDITGGGTQQVNFGNFQYILPTPPPGSTQPSFSSPLYYPSQNPGVTFPQGHTIEIALQQLKCDTSPAYGTFTVQ